MERTRSPILTDSTEDFCNVADFFDSVDRQFLIDNESMSESDLIPDISLPELNFSPTSTDSFESNGLPSSDFPSFTSTPNQLNTSAPFVFASPIAPPNQINTESGLVTPRNCEYLPENSGFNSGSLTENEISFEYLANVKNRPRRIIYSDESDIDLQRPELPERWMDRNIKCIKYVDDCLSLEKICFGLRGGQGEERRMLASKSQRHFRLVEENAAPRGMKLNKGKTRICLLYTSPSPRD